MKAKIHFRQGDILIERVNEIPTGLAPIKRDKTA